LSMQHVAEESAHLFARAAISNFEPCTLFVLAKLSTRLANHGNYVEDKVRFVSLTVSSSVSLHEHACEYTEAAVSCMVVAVFASTTNDRDAAWLKVSPKLRSHSFGTKGYWQFGITFGGMHLVAVSLQEWDGIGTEVEWDTCHGELFEYCASNKRSEIIMINWGNTLGSRNKNCPMSLKGVTRKSLKRTFIEHRELTNCHLRKTKQDQGSSVENSPKTEFGGINTTIWIMLTALNL
jgi:hypothetical protein